MENLGILAALGAALAWGSYAVPFKLAKSDKLIQFQAILGVGVLFSGLFFSLILGYPLSFNSFGLISGFLWAIANVISLVAVLNLGLSRSVPLVSSIVILSSFLWGALVFNELPSGIVMGGLGIGTIIVGVALVSKTGNSEGRNTKKGLIAALVGGLLFGSQLVPLKVGNVPTEDFFFSSALGVFIMGFLILAVKRVGLTKEGIKMSFLSGVIWNIGNLLSLLSIAIIGLAKGMPISQSATLVAVLWGIFFFREITQKKQITQVLIGAMVLLAGVIILSFS